MTPEALKQTICYSKAGFALTPLQGKRACSANWVNTPYRSPDRIEKAFKDYPDNAGVVLSNQDLVIDVDPRAFLPDDKPHVRLFKQLGLSSSDCCVVKTGNDGLHIYFKKPEDAPVKLHVEEYQGLEFKTRGSQVAAAGSIHPDTGKAYGLVAGSLEAIPQAPATLLEIVFKEDAAKQLENPMSEDEQGSELAVIQFTEYATDCPPAVEGTHGDKTTYEVACRGRDFGLTSDQVFEIMMQEFNPRCLPEWPAEELRKKVQNAYQYAQSDRGVLAPEREFSEIKDTPPAKRSPVGWVKDRSGQRAKNLANTLNYLSVDSGLSGIFFNEFEHRIKTDKKMPWHTKSVVIPTSGHEWTDADSKNLRCYLSSVHRFDVGDDMVNTAVLHTAMQNPRHPLKEWLMGLEWDGKPRLDKWAVDYCGADDTRFVRSASRIALLQAVARIFSPGCKADYVLILEGPQGIRKSTFIKALAGGDDYYADPIIDTHNKDTVEGLMGKWIIEFSEMEVAKRSDVLALRSFITRQTDRFRFAYGTRSQDIARQCVFIGTVNPDATGQYLTDTEGNRRFFPITTRRADIEGMQVVREQLFAEATDRVLRGEKLFIEEMDIQAEAVRQQRQRQTTDIWEEAILDFIMRTPDCRTFVTTRRIYTHALEGSDATFNNGHSRRIANVLKDLDFVKVQSKNPYGPGYLRGWVYRPIHEAKDLFE